MRNRTYGKSALETKVDYVVLTSVLVLLLIITSCGTPEPEFDLSLVFYEWESYEENITDLIPTEQIPGFDWDSLRDYQRDPERRHVADVSPFYGETLTVLVDHSWFGRHRIRAMADNFIRMHPGVNIEFIMLHDIRDKFESRYNDYVDIMCLLRNETAPVLIQTSATWTVEETELGTIVNPKFMNTELRSFFADWLPVMANHPGFDPSEWNMNVLNASRIHGELFNFPAYQQIRFETANRNIPGLAQTFGVKDAITVNELVELYAWHGGFGAGEYLSNLTMLQYLVAYVFPNFFNTSDGTVAFYSEEFIELMQYLYYHVNFTDGVYVTIDHNFNCWHFVMDELLSDNFFFKTLHDGFFRYEAFLFTRYDAYFINPLPVVTNDGRLIANTGWWDSTYSWILNTHDPVLQALAADFLLFMAGVFGGGVDYRNSPFYAQSASWGIFGIPARLGGTANFETVVERHWRWFENDHRIPSWARLWREGYSPEVAAERIVALISRLGEMEMVRNFHSEYLTTILWEEASYFANGTSTAEQTAQRLQERVTAQLNEWNVR